VKSILILICALNIIGCSNLEKNLRNAGREINRQNGITNPYTSTDKLCIKKGWIYEMKFNELVKNQNKKYSNRNRNRNRNVISYSPNLDNPNLAREIAEYSSPCRSSSKGFLNIHNSAPRQRYRTHRQNDDLKYYSYCFNEPGPRIKRTKRMSVKQTKKNYNQISRNCMAWNLNIAEKVVEKLKTKQRMEKQIRQAEFNRKAKKEADIKRLAENVNNTLNSPKNTNGENILWPNFTETKNSKIQKFKVGTFINLNETFNSLNSTIEYSNNYGFFDAHVFHANKKGEFEKTIEYKNRIKEENKTFNAKTKKEKEKYKNELNGFHSIILNKYFGKPIISNVSYKADSEIFYVTIKSDKSPYKITGEYRHSITSAQEKKIKIKKGDPRISFLLSNGVFKPKVALLIVDNKIITLNNIKYPKSTIKFGSNAAKKWKSKKIKNKKLKDAKSKKERNKYIAKQNKIRDARRRKYNHMGAFLKPKSIGCIKLKSIYKALAISRSHPYADIPSDCVRSYSNYAIIKDSEDLNFGGISRVMLLNGERILVSNDSIIN